jgi:hypothetical protein
MAPLAPEPIGDSLPNWCTPATPWELVPAHMREGLIEYVEHGHLDHGDFLHALLTNDLRMTFQTADHVNRKHVWEWLQFLFNYTPSTCWGSVEKVKAWQQRKGLMR